MRKLLILPLFCIVLALSAQAGQAPTDTQPGIHVSIEAVVATGKVVPVDGITSAGQPDAKAFKVFADAGYVAVIDMRGVDEDRGMENEPAMIEELGLEYVAFPIEDHDEINFENAAKFDELLQNYDGPVLVHCASGNRVGAMLALRASLHGADDEESLAYGKQAGMTRLEDVIKERLGEN